MPNISSPTPDATTASKGKVQLGGDIGSASGTAAAPLLSTSAIFLGYAQITTNFSTSTQVATQVTGLTLTVTVPSGGRRVKITAMAPDCRVNALGSSFLEIWDGTVGSGTRLNASKGTSAGASYSVPFCLQAVVTPSAGSKTYNISYYVDGNTGTLIATATSPAFILVELI